MEDFILKMKDVNKTFPGVIALKNVNFNVKKEEMHSICGENGAGKSTLIKILSGVYPANSFTGEILLEGKIQKFYNVNDAEKKGIVCIQQELSLIPEMSIAENIFLGREYNFKGIIRENEMLVEAQKLLEKVGIKQSSFKINLNEKIKNISIGQQQLIEIAKALRKNANILILDEPTSSITDKEINTLMDILIKLKEKGVTIIFISHKLDEVVRISDTVTVIRDGEIIGARDGKNISKHEIIRMMVGKELRNLYPREKHIPKEVGFEVKNIYVYKSSKKRDKKIIDNVSFNAYKGEILGIIGLRGTGRTELFTSIYGMFSGKKTGEVFINGKKINTDSPANVLKQGLGFITEDKKRFGLVMTMNIKDNFTLSSLDKFCRNKIMLDQSLEINYANKYIARLKIKTDSIETKAKNLSGGNMQKVVIAKALISDTRVLVLDEPTKGIDVGTKSEIYKIMNELVDSGVTVIMISSELDEIIGMSDRIIVMSKGKITGIYKTNEVNKEIIMNSMQK